MPAKFHRRLLSTFFSTSLFVAITCPATAGGGEVFILASRDNTLVQSFAGDVSNGSGTQVRCGRTGDSGGNVVLRAALAFDVAAAVPAGSSITAARLELHLTNSSSGPIELSLHRMRADWGEGGSVAFGGQGAPAEPGDATWLHRAFPATLWLTPGGDFDAASLATSSVGSTPAVYAWTSPALVEWARDWVRQPTTQFGLMLPGDEVNAYTAKGFASREHPETTLRPRLVIEFTPPCAADIAPPPDGDGDVNVADLLAVITAWGPCNGCPQDFVPPGGDSQVNVVDLLGIITAWGACS